MYQYHYNIKYRFLRGNLLDMQCTVTSLNLKLITFKTNYMLNVCDADKCHRL